MPVTRLYVDEPRPRWIGDIVDEIARSMAAEESGTTPHAQVRPVDTPAVSPWTGAPETFAKAEQPVRVNAATLGPLYESLGVERDGRPALMADWRTQAIASLPHDPVAKIGVFARNRFPELPLSDAMRRYGVSDDRVYYIDRDGTPRWEEPSFASPFGDPIRYASSWFGPAIPAVGTAAGSLAGSIGGSLAAGPGGGFYGGFYGAGAGGAVGEWFRQELAKRWAGENMSDSDRWVNTAIAGASGMSGNILGRIGAQALTQRYANQIPVLASGFVQIPLREPIRVGDHLATNYGLDQAPDDWRRPSNADGTFR